MADEKTKSDPRGSVIIDEERCKGCTYCVVFCPVCALEMSDKLNSKGYHVPYLSCPDKCTGCDLCGNFCPDFAIRGHKIRKVKDKTDDSK